MPPRPTRPMNSPWPIHSGQGKPSVEIDSPRPIISAPQITVQRVPTRSATHHDADGAEPGKATCKRRDRTHAANLACDVLERDRNDPGGAKRHHHDEERHRGDDPGIPSFDRGRGLQHECRPPPAILADRSRIDHCADLRSAARMRAQAGGAHLLQAQFALRRTDDRCGSESLLFHAARLSRYGTALHSALSAAPHAERLLCGNRGAVNFIPQTASWYNTTSRERVVRWADR